MISTRGGPEGGLVSLETEIGLVPECGEEGDLASEVIEVGLVQGVSQEVAFLTWKQKREEYALYLHACD